MYMTLDHQDNYDNCHTVSVSVHDSLLTDAVAIMERGVIRFVS